MYVPQDIGMYGEQGSVGSEFYMPGGKGSQSGMRWGEGSTGSA